MRLLCSSFMNVFRFRIIPMRLVVEGGIANLYGMVWAICICGVGVMACTIVTSLVSMYVWLLP